MEVNLLDCNILMSEFKFQSHFNVHFQINTLEKGMNPLIPQLKPVQLIGLVGRVFTNGPGDRGSIPGQDIPKTFKKWYLIPLCFTLSNIRYVSRVKWSNPGKGVAPSSTPRCSSY